jgi:hypothetical protein
MTPDLPTFQKHLSVHIVDEEVKHFIMKFLKDSAELPLDQSLPKSVLISDIAVGRRHCPGGRGIVF